MRAIWKGALTFGLVNIPIHMYTASQEKGLSFVMLHKKDMSEIGYTKKCKLEDREVPWNEIVKAYEYEKGEFVIVDEKDFEQANLKKTKTIEIINFIKEEDVDTIFYVKPYYLEPDKNSATAYSILREALKKSKKVGLAKYIIRNREHLAVLKVHENMIILNQLRYFNELVDAEELNIPEVKTKGKEIDIAIQLIEQQTVAFDPENYHDTYEETLRKIIKQKKSKHRPVHPKTKEAPATKVVDIMSLLQASLEKNTKKTRKTAR